MKPPHALPIWELEVEDDDPEDEPLANLALGAAVLIAWFAFLFVLLPAVMS